MNEAPRALSSSSPQRAAVLRWGLLFLISLAALWLRTADLAARPMHADEANQAVKTGVLLETGAYAFDPLDHHGPTLYYAALPIALLRGQRTLAALDETTVRLVPALAGTLAVFLLAWLAAPLGRWPALGAAALLAVSPPAVYYSRYFVQETLLVTFTLATFCGARAWWQTGRIRWALATGASVGLMLATKASAPIFLLAAIAALALARLLSPRPANFGRDALVIVATALLVAAIFYSSFGTHWRGLSDALASFTLIGARVTGDTGHEKPWWYYLALFGWQQNGGLVWQQLAFSTAALAGLVFAIFSSAKFLRWAALFTVLVTLALSCVAYKTPWHAIHLVPGFALLAVGALAALRRPVLAAPLFAFVVVSLALQTRLAVFQRAADARNPYAYVHSSPDVKKFHAVVAAARAQFPAEPVHIIGEEYWPLPWYLRDVSAVGYWPAPPEACDGAAVIATTTQADAVRARLRGRYRESFLGLRPGVLCVVFTREP
jgi:uncharacterized protein (TIGR03663 family)